MRLDARWRNLRLAMVSWVALMSFRLLLLFTGYRHIAALFPRIAEAPPPPVAGRMEMAALRASRYVPACTCLVQACAVRALLAIRGYGATMRVGVRAGPDGGLMAHAWLLSEGEVILGARVPDFGSYRGLADFN